MPISTASVDIHIRLTLARVENNNNNNTIQLSRPMSSGRYISMEHRLPRKHLLLNPCKMLAATFFEHENEET